MSDFGRAIAPHLTAGWNLARWLVRDAADAEDALQEACVRAFRHFGSFRGASGRAMSCNTALIELELDGELDARGALELSEHLARCPACTQRRASLRALGEAVRLHLPRYELPRTLRRKLFPRRWPVAAAFAAAA